MTADFLEKWQGFSLNQQLANVGSEISRAVSLKEKGDRENMKKSILRALELIDLTISDRRWKGRTYEIFKVREIICDMFFNNGANYNTKTDWLKNYFLFFALSN